MTYDIEMAAALLGRTPDVLRAMLHELPHAWLDAPEHEGAWTPREVACHMADMERDGWIPRVRTILDSGAAVQLPPIERERFRVTYRDAALERVLADFGSARAANLDTLRSLEIDAAALARPGRHGMLGAVTLAQLLSTWVLHDLTHIAQITRTLAAQYRDAVGPWQQYLSVLRQQQ